MSSSNIIEKFLQLSKIPRPSLKLDGVRSFINSWVEMIAGSSQPVKQSVDTYGNVMVSVGTAIAPNIPVIIQSHMDMVATKNADSLHNFDTDPIDVIIEGNIMRANGTTLGADNGMSLVASMYLVEDLMKNNSEFLQSNQVILLFTADEEIGCVGAESIDLYPFLPDTAYCLNVDSEVSGEVCAGSSGGADCHISLPICGENMRYKKSIRGESLRSVRSIKISGLSGGHSGININSGRASAIKILANILYKFGRENYVVQTFTGGNAHNAIPITACATINMSDDKVDELRAIITQYIKEIKERYNEQNVTCELAATNDRVTYDFANDYASKLVELLLALHQGIVDMNPVNNQCVETSTNIGVVSTTDSTYDINILSRSSDSRAMKEYHQTLSVIASAFGATITDFKCYDGWNAVWSNHHVLRVLSAEHQSLFGRACHVTKVHAGLETSILLGRYPGWVAMSIGPTIKEAHTPAEYCEIDTIEPFYNWLKCTVFKLNG